MSEDEVKSSVKKWLESYGWDASIQWGRSFGIGVEALRGEARWIIEARGCEELQIMRVSFFLALLGETLQAMSDEDAKYSVAFPDTPKYRYLWQDLPILAKERTGITALFVDTGGRVEEVG